MTAFVGPQLLLDYLLGQPPAQASQAAMILTGDDELLLTDVAFAEALEYLGTTAACPRERVAFLARAILGHPTIRTIDETLLLRAVELFERQALPFGTAYTIAAAERTGVGRVVLGGPVGRP